ncbi:CHAT domain-containing protein [Candidatus Parabeggiatoa sp. HSG14]|uniref:CHAT domain-containing protein n=1 Tax=Candidatus Parabeggiatoa sp. HSG14 TaxID=3055593 RepID=UPI0025A76DBA|nr:CHAT domain-containing protein [Thiotrichales bacterium HSG14]
MSVTLQNLFQKLSPQTNLNPFIFFSNVLILFLCCFSIGQAQPLLKAKQAFQQGHYEQAIKQWQLVLSTRQDMIHRLNASVGIAAAYRHLGLYDKALHTLNTALSAVHQNNDNAAHSAFLLNELTKLYLAQKKGKVLEKARQKVEKALAMARNINSPSLLAEVLCQWGNLLSAEYDYEGALEAYKEALTFVTQISPMSQDIFPSLSKREIKELQGQILINQAQTTYLLSVDNAYQYDDQKEAFSESMTVVEHALKATQNWPNIFRETFALIALSQLLQEIQVQLEKTDAQITHLTYQALNRARGLAERLDNTQAKTYIYGYMGHLYEQEKRYNEALKLTRHALFSAQQIHDQQLLYYWGWQLGRIHKAQGTNQAAIEAYRQAMKNINLKGIREQVVFSGYNTGTFRERVAPVYFELADLLLQEATKTESTIQRDKLLREARTTVEFFKQAELQDYFQSECVTAQTQCIHLEQAIDAQTAILYPIPLSDRLELLLSLPKTNSLIQATVPVTEKKLRREIAFFLSPLRRHPLSYVRSEGEEEEDENVACAPSEWKNLPLMTEESPLAKMYLKPAQKLYSWLVQPLAEKLVTHNIKTLVVVPEGVLRTLPFSALHDGQRFLVEDYALAATPGLCLGNLKPQQLDMRDILVSGLSEAVQGFSSLPCAKYEMEALKKLYNLIDNRRKPLFNKTFTYPNMVDKIRNTRYSVVHIASHGQFKAELENTFLLTYNDKLSMNKLERIVRRSADEEKPVELLTLSACETAVGNDRAALGLAGIALKAGVKSALASLWKVDDAATPAMLLEFYQQLTNPNVSKAQALQNAQKMMLSNEKYTQFQHPYYWSAFLLIGSWF